MEASQQQTVSSSPFVNARQTPRRVKLLAWGDSGSGKTSLALRFPRPVVLDLEGGTDYYTEHYSFDRLRTVDAAQVMEAVDWLRKNDHSYETLIIDPISVYWEALQNRWSQIFLNRNQKSRGYRFEFYEFQMKDWMTIKAEWKELIRKLIDLEMHVVVTARQKTLYAENGLRPMGETFDAEKTLPYLFDTIVHLTRNEKGQFLSICTKDRSSRLPTTPFPTDFSTYEKCLLTVPKSSQGSAPAGPSPSGSRVAPAGNNPSTEKENSR